jgi:dTDP-4-dehydrorhamnose 3,5-epimerase
MGERNPILLRIPPGVAHGMKAIGTEPGMLINTPSRHYVYEDPDEFRIHPHENDIPYSWDRKDG